MLFHTAASIFGPDVIAGQNKQFITETDFPLLEEFASNAECDYAIHGNYHGLEFGLYFPLKVYKTEWDRKISHWSTRYAVQIHNGIATIVFWESDLYDPESQMKLLAEALERY